MRRRLLLLLAAIALHAALPPGYEDVHYCPSNHCIVRQAGIDTSYSGPYSRIYECCNKTDGTSVPVRSWGVLVSLEIQEGYLADGLVESRRCAPHQCLRGFFITKGAHAISSLAPREASAAYCL